MKTPVTAIQKGGQGKTFTTCHLAFDFQERGLRVAVIDLDAQGNASWTLDDHNSGYLASRLFTTSTDALGEQISVWKIKKTAARKAFQEVRGLADYVFTKMEITQ